MTMVNQNPEQIARDNIDKQLIACGWIIQDKKKFNLAAGLGIAIREYQTQLIQRVKEDIEALQVSHGYCRITVIE